ncbi:6-phospho-beta-glucosidase [Paenarthrobacter sp. Z7-10]|uniref:6-phospho-beta-glucosidase n=1 Tax=Paenarthrobacter sp. Z7-10 TaxID=2787635 RepID=UPI0022A93F99|nr:6-phospho-beta-glucosidase [Paenarthrobacter sp. Z7-10]MCZ2404687.1 6-phospho-beta-glucosidase [Paenarthrobacter sp. Z7-10]
MKLCIVGGGGFRTPYVYQALLRDRGFPRVTEVALYDIDEHRLRSMVAILDQLAAGFEDAPRLLPTTSLEAAVEGSDFVFAAVRVGGLEGRRCDEHVALDLNVLGQETTGPGGLAYALRTIPVMMELATLVRELAPHAYVMNFTNPAGIITEAMQSVLGERVLGICDTPSGLGRRVAGLLGLDHTRVQMDYVGLNHLGWMRRVMYNGEDVLPQLLADGKRLSLMEEGHVFGTDWIRTLGVIPNEYLFYYYFNRDAVRGIIDSKLTRGDFLAKTQSEFFDRVLQAGDGAADLWRETVRVRGASYMAEAKGGEQGAPATNREQETDPGQQGYAGVALGVMAAIARNERSTMILNVRNGSTVQGLPEDAVIEIPTTVDANGVHPQTTAQPELYQLGLMQQVKAVERHTIAAALTGSREEALKAFALHPLVDSVTVARDLLAGYIDRIPEVARVLTP